MWLSKPAKLFSAADISIQFRNVYWKWSYPMMIITKILLEIIILDYDYNENFVENNHPRLWLWRCRNLPNSQLRKSQSNLSPPPAPPDIESNIFWRLFFHFFIFLDDFFQFFIFSGKKKRHKHMLQIRVIWDINHDQLTIAIIAVLFHHCDHPNLVDNLLFHHFDHPNHT